MIGTDFDLAVDDALIRQRLGRGADRVLKSQRNLEAIEAAKRELAELARPAAAWAAFPVEGVGQDGVVLSGGERLGSGLVVAALQGAAELVVGVCTVGQDMELRARECMAAHDSFHGLVLDLLASWAAGAVRDQLALQLRFDHYRPRGWHASAAFGPGDSAAWPIADQRAIFALLAGEVAAIGVRLEPSLLMVPLKSVSFVMGAGPGPLGRS
ncbi:MAG: hypothetical protein JW839_17860 [Candidatus Lokiarchaeota archaeon]|nr:hypothetical protein [Candidatus Lokiarchaeota archaeon]